MLSNIILYPLIQIIEVVYLAVHKVFKNFSCPAGYAIIGVSVAITFLCLPLYVVAEKWQQIERDTQKKLKPGIDRIKAVFNGDEQYMILSTFYRQNHYHPMMALRSSFGLLIQIPFFMAAYSYLSNLEELKGLSFLFIRDLGNPDATFYIGNFPVNILPIAMTLINCVAGAIYTKGFGWRDKIQIYGMALLFLVVLYTSPAGLVLYWTMNNVFSLVKNVFYKLKHPLWTLYGICCGFVLCADWFIFFKHTGFLHRRLMLIAMLSLVFFIPLILKVISFMLRTVLKDLVENKKACLALFLTSAAILTLALGLYIPTQVISSSPQEFSFIEQVASPFTYLKVSFWKSFGLCFFWPICIYFLFGKEVKACISSIFAFLAVGALLNIFIFPGNYGNLSRIMNLDNAGVLKAAGKANLLNLSVIMISIAVVLVLAGFKKEKWISSVYGIVAAAILIIPFSSFGKIKKEFKTLAAIHENSTESTSEIKPFLNFSKTKQNIFVIDFDRFIGAYVPVIFEEKPELKEKFSGFTFYPNTASYGGCTLIASPAMFGGYDYVPENIMNRSEESLVSKHNEACLAMPRLFSENGFYTTVTDISYANYSWIPDMSIYNDYPAINALRTEGIYTDLWLTENPESCGNTVISDLVKRNLFLYSIMRAVPTVFRDTLYNDGKYWNTDVSVADMQGFLNSYSVIDYLPKLTAFENDSPTYTFMVNDSTHEPVILQYPDYIPYSKVTDRGNGKFKDESQYHVCMASLLKMAAWFDYLKENDCYNNTKIIITSDHGSGKKTGNLPKPDDNVWGTYENINPVFLVKDFNTDGPVKTDMNFMTNADVAALSCLDAIKNPVNPFTGNPVDFSGKEKPLIGVDIEGWSPDSQNKNTFKVSKWYKLENGLFDPSSLKNITEEMNTTK
ncbi:MAG: YidC/Oxa1 family membrane protein insertase [Treponema sp.]|nr:YidC/Oxa1 family membrane protein insertase [Treponema sp.]